MGGWVGGLLTGTDGRPDEVQSRAKGLVAQGLGGINDVFPVPTHHDEAAVAVVRQALGEDLCRAQVPVCFFGKVGGWVGGWLS